MIKSMTGYARVETSSAAGRLTWELRSVNHRYLDVQFKLPDELRALEPALRQRATERVARGKLECAARFVHDEVGGDAVQVNAPRLTQLGAALHEVHTALPGCAAPDPMRVLAWPGVVAERGLDLEPLQAAASAAFEQALDEFSAAREREGARMAQFIALRGETLAGLVAEVQQRAPLVREQMLQRQRQKCLELGVEVDPQRLAQELVLAAQRLDVEEEMARLHSHLVEVRDALGRREAVGRRLDFLMQELNREANTTGSKSQDAQMTQLAVEMKVVIEQMREQVQNIE